jgi:hypothetical protein
MDNETLDYLVDSTIWSVGSLLVGYSLGRLRHQVDEIHAKVVRKRDKPRS